MTATETATLTRSDLIATIEAVSGTTFATITLRKPCRLNRKSRETGEVREFEVTETRVVNVAIGPDYARSVKRQLSREGSAGDFEAAPRAWGTRRGKSAVIDHKGGEYMEVFPLHTIVAAYTDSVIGAAIDPEALAPFRPAKKAGSGRQGTDKAVRVQTWAVENIVAIRINGMGYAVVDDDADALDTTAAAMLPELAR